MWSYPDPIPECPKIKGYLCFFNEHVDEIRVDGKADAAAGDAVVEGLEGKGQHRPQLARPGAAALKRSLAAAKALTLFSRSSRAGSGQA